MKHHINKRKNHKIISTDAEKSFDKIQHSVNDNNSYKMGTEGTYLNIIKLFTINPMVSS